MDLFMSPVEILSNITFYRSDSPEPVYDHYGKRQNTKDQRAKEKLNIERTKLIEIATAMNINFK
jgi:hypothetical protein